MTTAMPEPSRPLSESSRLAYGVGLCREQTRLNRLEDEWVRAGRPASALGGDDFRKVISDRYDAWIKGIAAINAANCRYVPSGEMSSTLASVTPPPVVDTASPPRRRRRKPAFSPV